jgi:simple sugar transport system permease protein
MVEKSGIPETAKVLIITILVSLLSACLLLFLFSGSFTQAAIGFFITPLSNTYMLGNLIASAIPLITAGIGVGIAFSSRNFNLGGEGQIYAGAFAAVLFSIKVDIGSPFLAQVLACFVGAATGAFIGWISGMLKRRLGVDEMISSFLLSAAVTFCVDFLITGPFQDPSSNFQTTVPIPETMRFTSLAPPSGLNSGILIVIALALVAKFLISRTRAGFELTLCGANREFARYCGVNTDLYTVAPMSLSGALHGLAGSLMVLGVYFKAMKGFSAGTGWSAITVSLIARNDPLAIIPASIFFAWLQAGAKSVMIGSNVSYEIVSIIQGVILFLVSARHIPQFSRKARRTQGNRA